MTYLADNKESADHFYMAAVLTGMSTHSATSATVSIRLKGDKGNSAKHTLDDTNFRLFQAGEEDWFILAEENTLGSLNRITIWVDYSNTSPSW